MKKSGQRTLIAGVGYRWQRDASFGLVVTDELSRLDRPEGVDVADLGYGAIYAAQDIADAHPPYERLVLLAGKQRGRKPGRLYRYRWDGKQPDAAEIQERIREAGAGVIDIDHLLIIGRHFSALPGEVVLIEMEPVDASAGVELSKQAARVVPSAIAMAREAAAGQADLQREVALP